MVSALGLTVNVPPSVPETVYPSTERLEVMVYGVALARMLPEVESNRPVMM